MKNIKAIIFDFDDTLALSNEEIIRTIERTAQACDLPYPEQDAIVELFGRPLQVLIETLWPFADADEFIQTYTKLYQPHNVKLVEGAKKTLEELHRQGFELHILSSRRKNTLQAHIEQFGLLPFFKSVIGYEDVTHHKPDSRVFEIFLKNYKPNEVAYVGDSIYDAQAAKQAGFHFIGVCTGIVTREGFELEKADLILKSVADLDISLL
ncbi:HAD family hydrolase [Candidatus Woesearchaeota archaeon]|nr:HAD family hydrolase [Candidatus Woesearchaeota archaeon]